MRFFICEHCGNIIAFVKDAGVPVMCCGQKMTELIPGSSDGAAEKHVPVIAADGNKVTVRVGDAGAVSFSVNGKDLGTAGKTGQVANKTFTKDGN